MMKLEEDIEFCIVLQKSVAKNIVLGFLGTHFMNVRVRFDFFILREFSISSNIYFNNKTEPSQRIEQRIYWIEKKISAKDVVI